MNEGSGEVDGCPVNLRQFSPLSRSTTMMPPGPVAVESVRYANPAFPCRRSNRTSLTYVVGVDVVEDKTIVFTTLFVAKSAANIFAQPGRGGPNFRTPVSSIQSRFDGSTMTLCTLLKVSPGLEGSKSFMAWSG